MWIQRPNERRAEFCGTAYVGIGFSDSRATTHFDCLWGHTIQHEFGHSLGFHHEQNNPDIKNFLKRPDAYEYFHKQFGYDKKFMDDNIFNLTQSKTMEWSAFDRESVMSYFLPGNIFIDGKPTGDNQVLSRGDKRAIARAYPGKPFPGDQEFPRVFTQDLTFRYTINNKATVKVFVDDRLVFSAETPTADQLVSIGTHFDTERGRKLRLEVERLEENGDARIDQLVGGKLETGEHSFRMPWLYCHNGHCNTTRSKDRSISQTAQVIDSEWEGTYDCGVYGILTLGKPHENSLAGTYTYKRGRVSGNLSAGGASFSGSWYQEADRTSGTFIFQKVGSRLEGRWTGRDRNRWFGGWDCSR